LAFHRTQDRWIRWHHEAPFLPWIARPFTELGIEEPNKSCFVKVIADLMHCGIQEFLTLTCFRPPMLRRSSLGPGLMGKGNFISFYYYPLIWKNT
jgi:hypothetical protein